MLQLTRKRTVERHCHYLWRKGLLGHTANKRPNTAGEKLKLQWQTAKIWKLKTSKKIISTMQIRDIR